MSRKIKLKTNKGGINPTFFRPRSWWTFIEERSEMIAPYINQYDAARISKIVREENNPVSKKLYSQSSSTLGERGFYNSLMNLLPNHLIVDIYNLYHKRSIDHEYAILNDTNKGKWKLLESVNDSAIKIVTNDNSINSIIFTIEICKAIIQGAAENLNEEQRHQVASMLRDVKAEQKKEDEEDDTDNSQQPEQQPKDDKNKPEPDSQGTEDSQPNSGSSQPQSSGGQQDSNQESGDGAGEGSKGDAKDQQKDNGQGERNSQEPGGNQGDSSSNTGSGSTVFEEIVSKIVDSQEFEDALSNAKKRAFVKISNFENSGMTTKELQEVSGNKSLDMIAQMDLIKDQISSINSNLPKIRSVIENILDKSTSYFSSKYKSNDLSIMDSDTIDELDGVEYFHPKLRKTHLDEVITREHKYKGKLNVYIDVSSSMNQHCNFGSTKIPKLLFAKALVIKMMDLDLVDKVIPFGSYLREPFDPPNPVTISLMTAQCGTNINLVIADCEARQENGVVVTDCEDNITAYSDKCFILGTSDARFRLDDDANNFHNNNQLWAFNPTGDDILGF